MVKEDNPFLSPEWQDMQRQYVEALSSFYPKQPTSAAAYTSPKDWNDALEFWWKTAQGQLDEKNNPVIDAMLDQSRIFYSITDQFANMFKEIATVSKDTDEWRDILMCHLEEMKSMFDQYMDNSAQTKNAPSFMCAQPIETWKQVMSGITILPEELLEKMMQQGSREFSDMLLSMPGLGMTGEFQENLQTTIRLWNEYQANSNKYREKFSELGKLALDKLGENIIQKANRNEKITSLKEIYNMWIDANEEAFSSYVYKKDYAKLYGDLVNSLMEFKKHSNDLSDKMLGILNIPTSAGVNTVTQRQHQIKNQLRSTMEMQQRTMDTLEAIRGDLQKIQSQIPAKKTVKTTKKSAGSKSNGPSKGKKKTRKSLKKVKS